MDEIEKLKLLRLKKIESAKKWQDNNPSRSYENRLKWRRKNPEKVSEYNKTYKNNVKLRREERILKRQWEELANELYD